MSAFFLLLDPHVLATPVVREAGVWLRYFEQLISWGIALRAERGVTSERAVAALQAERRYPTYDVIASAIVELGISEFAAADVHSTLRRLAETTPYLEDRLDVREVSASTLVDPAQVLARLPETVSAPLSDMLVASTMALEAGQIVAPIFGTSDLAFDGEPVTELVVETRVDLVETLAGDIFEPHEKALRGVVQVIQAPSGLPADSWEAVKDDPIRATAFAAAELRASDDSFSMIAAVRAGPSFVASLEKHAIPQQPAIHLRLYRLCALAAAGRLRLLSGGKLHPVRTSAAADAPQVCRENGDKKWRCMLSRAGAGYRLHYWEGNGVVELAEVVVESEA